MYRRKRSRARMFLRYGRKSIVLAAALVIAITGAVGGTLAWLIDDTDPITNTFTYGDINIELDETDADGDEDPDNNTYEMYPGVTIEKDPRVTVLADSKDSWLFVKLEESENFDEFLVYAIADGWTALDGEEGVYYRTTTESDQDQVFEVLEGNQVKVKESVTKDMLNALNANGENNYPTLTITAYAVQLDSIATAGEAWALVEADAANG